MSLLFGHLFCCHFRGELQSLAGKCSSLDDLSLLFGRDCSPGTIFQSRNWETIQQSLAIARLNPAISGLENCLGFGWDPRIACTATRYPIVSGWIVNVSYSPYVTIQFWKSLFGTSQPAVCWVRYTVLMGGLDEVEASGSHEIQLDDDLAMTQTELNTRCPVTMREMVRPVRNVHCGHSYDYDGAKQLISNRQQPRLVVVVISLLIIRLHRIRLMRNYCDRWSLCLYKSVCHAGRLCQSGWTDRRPVWSGDSLGSKKLLDGRPNLFHPIAKGPLLMLLLPNYFGLLLSVIVAVSGNRHLCV